MRRRGLSLIEVLIAVGLLTMVVLALATWLRLAAQVQAEGPERWRQQQAEQAALRLLRLDLAEATAAPELGRDGALLLRTVHDLPGTEAGEREVRWAYDADAGLWQRQSQLAGRPASRRPVLQLSQGPELHTQDSEVFLRLPRHRPDEPGIWLWRLSEAEP